MKTLRHLRIFPIGLTLLAFGCAEKEREPAYPVAETMAPERVTIATTEPMTRPVAGMEDRQFVAAAASSGKFEVASSHPITQQATRPEVVDFAQRMMIDHRKANQELEGIAAELGIPIAPDMAPKHRELMNRIEAAPAGEVSELYLNIQRQAHEEAIELFERCASECESERLRTFATQTLPTLRSHLDHVQRAMLVGP